MYRYLQAHEIGVDGQPLPDVRPEGNYGYDQSHSVPRSTGYPDPQEGQDISQSSSSANDHFHMSLNYTTGGGAQGQGTALSLSPRTLFCDSVFDHTLTLSRSVTHFD